MAFAFWFFFAQKFWEFLDTWFFILKKNFRQVTFLHVYHHSSITFVVGLVVPYSFSGDFYLPILLNSIVHVIMYSYYLLMVLKVKFPWKNLITILQLVQFCIIMTQNILSSCFSYFSQPFLIEAVSLFVLFFRLARGSRVR